MIDNKIVHTFFLFLLIWLKIIYEKGQEMHFDRVKWIHA